jgi:hypothetical protein
MAFEMKLELAGRSPFLIVVPARVNGQGPFRFAVDTGGAHTSVSVAVAQQAGIAGWETTESFGVGSPIKLVLGEAESVAVGDARVERLRVAIADLSPFAQRIGEPIDGVLAHDFLRHFVLQVDYPRGLFRLT